MRRAPIAVALVVLLALAGCSRQPGRCGSEAADHCYGTIEWTHPLDGASVMITNVPMTAGEGIFVTKELWLMQRTGCPGSEFNVGCWVEAGLIAEAERAPHYFWAEHKPGGGVDVHIVRPIPEQAMGTQSWFVIRKNPYRENQIDVLIANPSDRSSGPFTASSMDNGMVPSSYVIGEEMAGSTNGAHTNHSQYDFIAYSHDGAQRHDDTNGRQVSLPTGSSPIRVYWVVSPSEAATDNRRVIGGLLETFCC